jgi:hypothetical protein
MGADQFTVLSVNKSNSPHDEDEVLHPIFDYEMYKSIGLLRSLGILDHLAFLSGKKGKVHWFAEAVALTDFGVRLIRACDPEIRELHNKSPEATNSKS